MHDLFNPGPAAAILADAWKNGTLLTELPAAVRPRTLTEGYEVQDVLNRLLGHSIAGWKLAVGSPKAKRAAGHARSLAGRVPAAGVHRDGDDVRLPNAAPVTVEFEIAFVLADDIAPGQAPAEPLAAVASTHVAFELVLSRFVDRIAVGWPSFTADNAASQALVVGPAVDPAEIGRIAEAVVVFADGEERARAATGENAIDPPFVLTELFAHAAERGLTLKAGELVTTGTLSIPFNVAGPVTELEGRFPGGVLRTRLVRPSL